MEDRQRPDIRTSNGWKAADLIVDRSVKVAKGSVRMGSATLKGLKASVSSAASSATDAVIRRTPGIADRTDDFSTKGAKIAAGRSLQTARTGVRGMKSAIGEYHLMRARLIRMTSRNEGLVSQRTKRRIEKHLDKSNRLKRGRTTYHYDAGTGRITKTRNGRLRARFMRNEMKRMAIRGADTLSRSDDFATRTIGQSVKAAWEAKRIASGMQKTARMAFRVTKAAANLAVSIVTGISGIIASVTASVPVVSVGVVIALVISILSFAAGASESRINGLISIIDRLQQEYSIYINPVDLLCISYGLGWTDSGNDGEYYDSLCRIIYRDRKDAELTLSEQCRILLVDNNPARNENYVRYQYGWDEAQDRERLKELGASNEGGTNALEISRLNVQIEKKRNEYMDSIGHVFPSFHNRKPGEERRSWGSDANVARITASITAQETVRYNTESWDKAYREKYGNASGSAIALAARTEMNRYLTDYIRQGADGIYYRNWAKSKAGYDPVAWCATWVWYVLVEDVHLFGGNEIKNFQSTVAMYGYFEKRGQTQAAGSGYSPVAGDLVFWKKSDGQHGHIGIVTGADTFVSGNTSNIVREHRISSYRIPDGRLYGYVTLGASMQAESESGLEAVQGSDNAAKAWNFLKKKGFSDEAAAGVLGNLQAESGINPGYAEKGWGYGIASWIDGRMVQMTQGAPGGNWKDLTWQLNFLLGEMAQKKWSASYRQSGSPDDRLIRKYYPSYAGDPVARKTWDFMLNYEYVSEKGFLIAHGKNNSKGPKDRFTTRVRYAKGFYDKYRTK